MKVSWASLLLLVLWSTRVPGIGGKLTGSSLGYRSDLDASRKEEIQKVVRFMKEDLSFIEGGFINQFSNQRFGATAALVSRFIGLLKGVGPDAKSHGCPNEESLGRPTSAWKRQWV